MEKLVIGKMTWPELDEQMKNIKLALVPVCLLYTSRVLEVPRLRKSRRILLRTSKR